MERPKRSEAAVPVLPDDALVEILSRVPARSLCRFKCVSKAWRDLIADRLRCTRLPQTLEGFFYAVVDEDDGEEFLIHGGSNDDGGGVSSDRVVHGRFINMFGRFAPLASYSYLVEQPGIDTICLTDSCNGLLLFGHRRDSDKYDSLGYVVCNPATEQWVAVPRSGCGWEPFSLWAESEDSDSEVDTESNCAFAFLIFDPAVSSHFQLVEFWTDDDASVEEVLTYSSETGVWCKTEWSSDKAVSFTSSAFVRGMLHFSATTFKNFDIHQKVIVAVDGEGKSRRIISGLEKHSDVVFVGQSQGCLHCVNRQRDNTREMAELCIWVLPDYDKEEWTLKHSVTFMQLFGRMNCQVHFDYRVIAIHPDRNVIFYVQHWDLKLKSYDMDSKEVCTLRTLKVGPLNIYPYVPYFAESSALVNKH